MALSIEMRSPSRWPAVVAALVLGCSEPVPTPAPPAAGEPPAIAWGQWRGPDGLGVSSDSPLPLHWSADGRGVRWKAPLPGKGHSSPVVAAGRVFLTAAVWNERGELDRTVLAFDLAEGAHLFTTPVFDDVPYPAHLQNSNATATPATDGEAVYAFFGTTLGAVGVDGRLLWHAVIDETYPEHAHWGSGSSPILFEDLVVVLQDTEGGDGAKEGWLAAFDRRDGREVWRRTWSETCCSYNTPLLWRRGDQVDLVVAHSNFVQAYDPRTGSSRWSHAYDINQFVASPVVFEDLLCTLGGAHHVQGGGCFRVSGAGADAAVERLWWDPQASPEDSSPVLYDGKLFAVATRGVMTAHDPWSGELLWRHRLPTKGHHASLVAGDGKVYALSQWGTTAVVDATSREFVLLAENDLGEKASNASPAIAGGCLLVRTRDHLVCIEAVTASPS
jgi:outer membrane protein assembly factor BamB